MEFCKKSRIPPFSGLLCWTGKNLWCNMSLVFSGNFLIASFSQETPCHKVEAHIGKWKEKGLHHNPYKCVTKQRSKRVSLVWSRLNGLLGDVFSFLIMFSILGWSFVFYGSSASHPIGSCFLSKSYF